MGTRIHKVIGWGFKYTKLANDPRFNESLFDFNHTILDATVRALKDRKPERVDQLDSILDAVTTSWKEEKETMELSHQKTLDSLEYTIERTKVFEALAEMIYKSGYDNIDGIKKIYEAVREKYPVGTYCPPCEK